MGNRLRRILSQGHAREMRFADQLLRSQRRVASSVLALFFGVYVLLSLWINLVLFRSDGLAPLRRATDGLITSTLIANLGLLLVCVCGLLIGLGRMRWPDLVGPPRAVRRGVQWTITLWVAVQLGSMVLLAASGRALSLAVSWTTWAGVLGALGALLAQIAGNALFEEIAFRGVLLSQVYRALGCRLTLTGRIFVAVTLSQVVFALIHIPNRIYAGLPLAAYPGEMLRLLGLGAAFAVIYLRTGNLILAAGIHALLNAPTPLLRGISTEGLLLAGVGLLLLIGRRSWFGRGDLLVPEPTNREGFGPTERRR